jgi:hypothetical protein
MVSQEYNGKTYTGRDLLDVAIMINDDKQDAKRKQARHTRTPRKSDKCSSRSDIFRL